MSCFQFQSYQIIFLAEAPPVKLPEAPAWGIIMAAAFLFLKSVDLDHSWWHGCNIEQRSWHGMYGFS